MKQYIITGLLLIVEISLLVPYIRELNQGILDIGLLLDMILLGVVAILSL